MWEKTKQIKLNLFLVLERCLNGGEEIQELISELYLDKQELEVCDFDVLVFHFIQKYLDYHYAGGIGLNFTGVRFGRRSKAPRRSAEHIFILSSSDSSEDEEQGQNSSTKRPSKKKEATKNREEQTVEVNLKLIVKTTYLLGCRRSRVMSSNKSTLRRK